MTHPANAGLAFCSPNCYVTQAPERDENKPPVFDPKAPFDPKPWPRADQRGSQIEFLDRDQYKENQAWVNNLHGAESMGRTFPAAYFCGAPPQ